MMWAWHFLIGPVAGLGLIALGARWLLQEAYPELRASTRRSMGGRLLAGLCLILAGIFLLADIGADAAAMAPAPSPTPSPRAAAPIVRVPESSAMYRRWVEQAATEVWGVDASSARLAAQLHQESRWNPKARSPVGAEGLAQFMPATARWIAEKFPRRLGGFDPWDPQQAAMAAAMYDQYLVERNAGATACGTWAFALSAYNGGELRLHQEQALADHAGRDPRTWFGSVARYRSRSPAAWRQNRDYVRQILTVLEPAYIDAGWSGQEACHV